MGDQAEWNAQMDAIPADGRLPDPQKLDLNELVSLIAAGSSPPWLADLLAAYVSTLAMNRSVVAFAPSRVKLKKKLDRIKNAAMVISNALQDNDLQLLVGASQLADAAPRERFSRQMQVIAKEAEKETAALLGANGKVKAGAGHAFTNQSFSAEVECAVLIAESWQHVRGRYPAPRHVKAHKAADLLWKISGGKRRMGADNPLETWRPHFRRAIRTPAPQLLEEFRSDVRRRLRDAAHCHAVRTEGNTGENGLI